MFLEILKIVYDVASRFAYLTAEAFLVLFIFTAAFILTMYLLDRFIKGFKSLVISIQKQAEEKLKEDIGERRNE